MAGRIFAAIAFGATLAASAATAVAPTQAQEKPVVHSRFADVDGIKIHYLLAGKGEPIILLHGYAQNSHMWRPLEGVIIKGSGHWLIDEAPDQVIPKLVAFLTR